MALNPKSGEDINGPAKVTIDFKPVEMRDRKAASSDTFGITE